jgi:hypothetical protein
VAVPKSPTQVLNPQGSEEGQPARPGHASWRAPAVTRPPNRFRAQKRPGGLHHDNANRASALHGIGPHAGALALWGDPGVFVGVAESTAMGFLKRIFGGGGTRSGNPPPVAPDDPVDIDAAERAYDLELARSEQDRLDELSQRQLRYADYSWQPPKQGGERRADDEEERADRG